MIITAEKFKQVVGVNPDQDDLERCNCKEAGKIGHSDCGWDKKRDMPKFIPGKAKVNIMTNLSILKKKAADLRITLSRNVSRSAYQITNLIIELRHVEQMITLNKG